MLGKQACICFRSPNMLLQTKIHYIVLSCELKCIELLQLKKWKSHGEG